MTIYVRYSKDGVDRHGELDGEMIKPLDGTIGSFRETTDAPLPLASVRLLAPTTPSKIIAIGPGYKAHFGGQPVPYARTHLWFKPASALLDPEGVIELPPGVPMTCHESELAIVIGKTAKDVPAARAAEHILGYTCINDVTAGEMTNPAAFIASQWFVDGKVFDTFAPLGPWIVTDLDPTDVLIECRVNGELRQSHRTSDRIWPWDELIAYISSVMTLNPGDVIATGSPPGVAPLADGDTVEVTIAGIGTLRNSVRSKVAMSG